MPVYEYVCPYCGGKQDAFFKIRDRADGIPCICGKEAVRIISAVCVQGDELPSYLRDPQALACLQPASEKPIETRSEYKKYLKTKGIAECSANKEF